MADKSTEENLNDLVAKYAPSLSRSMMVQAVAQAMGNASHNATFAQQQQNMIINTNTALCAAMVQSVGAAKSK